MRQYQLSTGYHMMLQKLNSYKYGITNVGPDTAGHLIGRSLQAAIRFRFRAPHESRSQVRRGFHATLRVS